MNSPWNADSKTDQDFDDWSKIDGVIGKKLKVGQFQNLHAMTAFHWGTTGLKSEKKSKFFLCLKTAQIEHFCEYAF